MKAASDWAKDPNFHEIIVRNVSEANFGIQFVYFGELAGLPNGKPKKTKFEELRDDLKKRFGAVYAWDVHSIDHDNLEEVLAGVVTLKSLTKRKEAYTVDAGVFKLDYKVAGWPDLVKVGSAWAKDPNFHEIIVRNASERNLGIQFVYVYKQALPATDLNKGAKYRELGEELKRRFGKYYACDISTVTVNPSDGLPSSVVVLKAIKE
jgi:hypothetical protein